MWAWSVGRIAVEGASSSKTTAERKMGCLANLQLVILGCPEWQGPLAPHLLGLRNCCSGAGNCGAKFVTINLDLLVCTGQGVAVRSLLCSLPWPFCSLWVCEGPSGLSCDQMDSSARLYHPFFQIAWFALVTGKRWRLFVIVVFLLFLLILVVSVCFLVLQGLQLFVHHCNELFLCLQLWWLPQCVILELVELCWCLTHEFSRLKACCGSSVLKVADMMQPIWQGFNLFIYPEDLEQGLLVGNRGCQCYSINGLEGNPNEIIDFGNILVELLWVQGH